MLVRRSEPTPEISGSLWGQKVVLRPYTAGFNEAELRRLYRWSTDKEVLRWSGGTPLNMSLAEFKDMLHNDIHQPNPHRQVFIILTHAGEMIGRIGVFNIDPRRRQAELGVVIGEKAYWGLGYGADAIQILLKHVFTRTDLQRVYLHTYVDNIRAQRAFAKCGFRPLNSRPSLWNIGSPAEMQMEITRDDWRQMSNHKYQMGESESFDV